MSEPRMDGIVTGVRPPMLAFQGILHSFFDGLDAGEGIVLAFTSANAGEGVSHVSRLVRSQLSASCEGSTHYVSSHQLYHDGRSGSGGRRDGYAKNGEWKSRGAWEEWRHRVSNLRACHRYSIIDCPSVSTSSDALTLAPHVDGIVVVVAANETRKAQIANVERQIQMVNGKILGYVLNKRKYMVPDWLYKLL
jgi:hypothetical protein